VELLLSEHGEKQPNIKLREVKPKQDEFLKNSSWLKFCFGIQKVIVSVVYTFLPFV